MPQKVQKKVKSIHAPTSNSDVLNIELSFQDICPLCGYGFDMASSSHHFHDYFSMDQLPFKVISLHCCSHCHKLFVTEHEIWPQSNDRYFDRMQQTYPMEIEGLGLSPIPKSIQELSPRFIDIYMQVTMAKFHRLSEIYGMGMRKALECLIKDYALYKYPSLEDEIARKPLARCVTDFIDNDKIQKLSTTCRIIGNNETHWRNQNTQEDIEIMERMLQNIMQYIQLELSVEEAEEYNANHGATHNT